VLGNLLSDGIESLPPGRTLMWPLGAASKVVNQFGRHAYKFTVTAKGPFGPVPALTYIIDMKDWWNSLDQPEGSLHQLTWPLRSYKEDQPANGGEPSAPRSKRIAALRF
jgi:hypothetical protein